MRLSRMQRRVLLFVARGYSHTQVAERLERSPRTVRNHLSQAYRRLNANGATHAVVLALKSGEITQAEMLHDACPPAASGGHAWHG